MADVLIVDDDSSMCELLSLVVKRQGHGAAVARTLAEGIKKASEKDFDVLFLDICLPDGNGLEALPLFNGRGSSPEIIIITGKGDLDGAELAIRHSVWDYIQKPATIQAMTLPFLRALQYREEKKSRGENSLRAPLDREGIIGSSPQLMACFDLLAKVARMDSNVLITGETGTGKELFALAVHRNSKRAAGPFVVLDCSSIPETLVESALFGHDKGAFTGADRVREGFIKQADGGTLFLDELGELPPGIQKAFLRGLQERSFRPIGGKREIKSDFRLVAATNRDLRKLVEEGRFREDLLFRIKNFDIRLPPLRERPSDIVDLALYHIERVCGRYGITVKKVSREFMEALKAHLWPGNVRELFHSLERAVATGMDSDTLFPVHLPDDIRMHLLRSSIGNPMTALERRTNAPFTNDFPRMKDYRNLSDKIYLRDLLARTGKDVKQACILSGLSRSRLYALLKLHGIAIPD